MFDIAACFVKFIAKNVVSVKSGPICIELPSEDKGNNVANAGNELPSGNVANAGNELPSVNVSNVGNVIDGLGTQGSTPNNVERDMSMNTMGRVWLLTQGQGGGVCHLDEGVKTTILPGGESESEISLIEIEDNGDYSEEVMFDNAISSEESNEDFVLNDSEDDGLSDYASDNEVNVDDSENETYDHMHRKKKIL
ncbi:hypothetical protein GH714_008126 [Hevea brasiliensis]|uniref:Uncharacterized protein n=1 Tax=Hevea brasiliensis TaxID=3981 RepID=A0A6A6LHS7_HEVBR|nr:hypothetical protein GH714_008126 [Hevea brasiliensis]